MEPSTALLEKTGDLGGHKIAMSINKAAMQHIMKVLTELYSNPTLAVIRELSTNALDSHIAAGINKPIEVTLPNPLSQFFTVKDYGVGLSIEDIENIYSQYGASTKRHSNDYVGMLGFGAKAPWAYTAQFNVVAVKQGIKISVSCSRVEDGTAVMEIVDERPTTEPDGLEVVVPVKLNNTFAQEASQFFSVWEPGKVLVNGEAPSYLDKTPVVNNIYTAPAMQGSNKDFVVMGNVRYPAPRPLTALSYNYGARNFAIYLFVGIGDVDITPNREALQDTEKTTAVMNVARERFDKHFLESIRREIDACATKKQALAVALKWKDKIPHSTNVWRTYRGMNIPMESFPTPGYFEYKAASYSPKKVFHYAGGYTVRNNFKNIPVIYGYNYAGVASSHRAIIKQWMQDVTGNVQLVHIFRGDKFWQEWHDDPTYCISWSDLKKKYTPVREKRTKPVYEYYHQGTWHQTEGIETTGTILYAHATDKVAIAALTKIDDSVTIVELTFNRLAKFQRLYPQAIDVKTYVIRAWEAAGAALTEFDKMVLNIGYDQRWLIKDLTEDQLLDPKLKELCRVAKSGETVTIKEYNRAYSMTKAINRNVNKEHFAFDWLKDRYPVGSMSNKDHRLLYLNAAYKEFYEKEETT